MVLHCHKILMLILYPTPSSDQKELEETKFIDMKIEKAKLNAKNFLQQYWQFLSYKDSTMDINSFTCCMWQGKIRVINKYKKCLKLKETIERFNRRFFSPSMNYSILSGFPPQEEMKDLSHKWKFCVINATSRLAKFTIENVEDFFVLPSKHCFCFAATTTESFKGRFFIDDSLFSRTCKVDYTVNLDTRKIELKQLSVKNSNRSGFCASLMDNDMLMVTIYVPNDLQYYFGAMVTLSINKTVVTLPNTRGCICQ